jgi:DNA-binding transcriptional MerR regulator
LFDVAPSLIRHWEKHFSQLHTKRTRKGNRQFTTNDIRNIEKIYTLVKERGFTLEGAKQELNKATSPNQAIISRLQDIQHGLLTIKHKL